MFTDGLGKWTPLGPGIIHRHIDEARQEGEDVLIYAIGITTGRYEKSEDILEDWHIARINDLLGDQSRDIKAIGDFYLFHSRRLGNSIDPERATMEFLDLSLIFSACGGKIYIFEIDGEIYECAQSWGQFLDISPFQHHGKMNYRFVGKISTDK